MTDLKLSEREIIKQQFRSFVDRVLKPTKFDTGCFGGVHQKYWVNIGDKEYMFKYNNGADDYSDFGEVFVSYLSFVLGYKCISATFCKDFFENNEEFYKNNKSNYKIYGTLIESFRTPNVVETISLTNLMKAYKKRYPAYGVTTWEVASICADYCYDNKIVYPKNLEQELKTMALLDYIFVQIDRGTNNIEFLIEEKHGKKYLKLAPMFDNGYCLHLVDVRITQEMLESLNRKTIKFDRKFNPQPDFFIEKTSNPYDNDGRSIIPDLAAELIRNKSLMKLFKSFENINIEDEINFVCSLYSRELPQIKKDAINLSMKHRIDMLKLEIIKQSIKGYGKNKNECDFKL